MDKKKIAVLSVSALNIMTNASLAPVLFYLNQAFPEVSITNIRLLLTLPALVIIFSSLLTGYLASRMPKRTLLFIGLFIYLLGGVGAGFCNSFTAILVMRIMVGLGAGVTNTFATSLISNFYKGEERTQLVGYSSVVAHAVAIAAPLITGTLASISWRYAFGIYLLAVVVMIITWFWLPEPPQHENGAMEKKLVLNNMVYVIAFNTLLFMATFYIFPTGIAHLFHTRGFGDSRAAGLATSISTSASTLINFFFAPIIRFFKRFVWVFGLGFMVLGFFIIANAQQLLGVYCGVFVSGCGTGVLLPAIMLRATQYAPKSNPSRAVSLVVAGSNLGMFLSPMIYAFYQRMNPGIEVILFDFRMGLILFSTALLIALVLVIIPNKKRGQRSGIKMDKHLML